MIEMRGTACCGLWEVNNLSHCGTPADALRELSRFLRPADWHVTVPFILFTGIVGPVVNQGHARSNRTDDYGEAFAAFLEANKLGEVTRSQVRQSWTGNFLRVWLWHPCYETLVPFLDKLENK